MIFCGDCERVMSSAEYRTATEGRDVIIVTDPPFNVGYHYSSYSDKRADYFEWLARIFGKEKLVCVHYPEGLHKLTLTLNRAPEKVVSWVYNSNTAKQHRDIAYYGIKPDFNRVKQPYKNPNDRRVQKLIESGRGGARLYDWWNVNQVKNVSKEKTVHPCQMPVEVMQNAIGIIPTTQQTVIVDPFMGAGTTGVACKTLGIEFIGIELDEEYFEIAKERLSE